MQLVPHRIRKPISLIGLAILALLPLSAVSDQPKFLDRLVQKVEPDLTGSPKRLQEYVDAYQHEFGNDPRLFAFEIIATAEGSRKVRLTGFAEIPEMHKGLVELLERFGFDVIDEIEELPANDLGDQPLGIVKTTHSFSYDQPGGKRSVVTDCLLGDPVFLLREEEDHLFVHSREGYLGYVSADDIVRTDSAKLEQYTGAPGVRISKEHQTESGLLIPVGARLRWVDTQGATVNVELPTGEHVGLPASKCELRGGQTEEINEVIQNARSFLGTKYVWGGKTKEGIDCSGLVQVAFYSTGINLPRDSNQQYLFGTLTATRQHRGGMRRGDTLYFLGPYGKVRHTALYLGDDRYLQAETPVVDIRSFNPGHDDYDARRAKSFVFAKRLLD